MSIKVGLYKIDTASEKHLRTVFKMVYKNQCIITEIKDAHTILVNVDKNNADDRLQELKNMYPKKAALLLCDEIVNIDGVKCLTRPFKLPELLQSLKQSSNIDDSDNPIVQDKVSTLARKTAESLRQKLNSKNQASPFTSVNESSNIYYQPNKFLQGKVTSAIEKANTTNKTVFLRCLSHRWIVISPSSEFLLENIKEKQLKTLGIVATNSDSIIQEESFSEKQIMAMSETPVNEVKAISIHKFVWDVTVRTSRGRIPENTSLNQPYVLTQWPNITRLSKIQNSIRISAFWLDRARTINDVITQLNIPFENVFTYFSAAKAAGLIKEVSLKEDKAVNSENNQVGKKKKKLFSSILKKLTQISVKALNENKEEQH